MSINRLPKTGRMRNDALRHIGMRRGEVAPQHPEGKRRRDNKLCCMAVAVLLLSESENAHSSLIMLA